MHSYFLPLLTSFLLKHAFCSKIPTPKIAVIGGGIGAASTTHFLTELFNNDLKIDLYEANKIGGRLATIQIDDNEYEAGGSIIHSQNKYMQEFVHLLGMEHKPSREQKFAIWNGTDIIFEASNVKIFTLAKLMYKYGIQPFKLNSYVDSILADFAKIYHLQSKGQSFMNVTSMLMAMNKEFPKLLQVSIKDQLLHLGYAEELIDELVEAPLLADYGQTKTAVHSFVGFVTLSATTGDIWSVKGGNKKVPEHLIYRNVNVNVLSSIVKKIHYETINNFPNYEVHYSNKDNVMKNHYDIVILATPLRKNEKTHITFEGIPGDDLTFLDEYQTVIATFIKGDINPNYFGLEEELDCILICNYNIEIRSIGRIDTVEGPTKINSKIWKIFSNASLPLTLLNNIFLNIEEVKEVAWKAYPRYTTKARLDKFKLNDGLYHVNAIEWVASAMEMSAIAGRNVAILAHDEYLQRFSNQANTSSTPNTPNTPNISKDTQKIEL